MKVPFRVKRSGPHYWAVFNSRGSRVSNQFIKEADAERACKTLLATSKERTRNCMACGTEFISQGPHNRLCDRCRQRRDASDPMGIGRRHGRAK